MGAEEHTFALCSSFSSHMPSYNLKEIIRFLLHGMKKSISGGTRMLFGEYLLKKGLVTKEQLLQAIEHQKNNWAPIGKVAITKKLITIKQVFEILDKQVDSPKKFGEIAVDLGYLTPEDVDRLLVIQRETNPHIGEVLVTLKYLNHEVLVKEVFNFLKTVDGPPNVLSEKLR